MRRTLERIRRELSLYRTLMLHPRTPWLPRLLLGGAIAYFLSPIDLVPDFIPVLGQLDDLVIVGGLVFLALALVPADIRAECRERAAHGSAEGGRRG